MLRVLRSVPLCASLLVLNAPLLGGQSASAAEGGHHGFHWAVGLGARAGGTNCIGGCIDPDGKFGPSFLLRFGIPIRPNLIVAGEAHGWYRSGVWLPVVLQYYPHVAKGFFLKGGVGPAGFDAKSVNDVNISNYDWGAVVGLGYDPEKRRGFAVMPYIDALYAPQTVAGHTGPIFTGDPHVIGNYSLGGRQIHVGVAASFHGGR